MKSFLKRWLVTTIGVLVAAQLVHGITYDTFGGLVVASLLLGVFNAVLRPVMMILTLPLVVLSLGLFMLVINAALLYLVGALMARNFHVDSFSAAFWGSLIISLVSFVANRLIGPEPKKQPPQPSGTSSAAPPPVFRKDEKGGPIIDV